MMYYSIVTKHPGIRGQIIQKRGEIMALKEKMLEYRAKNNLSQRKAAAAAGITLQTWYSVENGYQTPSKLTEKKILLVIDGKEGNEE